MIPGSRGLLLPFLVAICFCPTTRATDINKAEEERILKAAGVGSDDAALFEYFQKRSLSKAGPQHVLALIRQLGDDEFAVRQKASEDLVEMGMLAVPFLRQASKSADPEVVRRAEECLQQIDEGDSRLRVTVAALRLVAFRKPAGSVEKLLAFAPFADNEFVVEELREALAGFVCQNREAGKVIAKSLTDEVPVRRALAAEVLCRAGAVKEHSGLPDLLRDPDLTVRLRAATALAGAKEKSAIPVLIDLLAKLPQPQAWQAEDLLLRLAENAAPAVSLGEDETASRKCRDAWLTWWRKAEANIDLGKLEGYRQLKGYSLIVLLDAGKVLEIGPDNKPRFEIDGLVLPLDAQLLSGDRLLIAENRANRVSERDLNGTIVWEKQVAGPLMAQRLSNGHTFIATLTQLLEVNRDGKEVFSYARPNGETFMKVQKLANGDIACITSLQNARQYVRLNPSGKEIQNFPVNLRTSGGRVEVLPGGRVLVPEKDLNRVVEYDAAGKIVWQIPFEEPVAAVRLPNGNTLVTSMSSKDSLVPAMELDRTGKKVWEYGTTTRVTRVFRR